MTTANIDELLRDGVFRGCVTAAIRCLEAAQSQSESPTVARAINALLFTVALLQEASPEFQTPQGLRKAVAYDAAAVATMLAYLRERYDEEGERMLEILTIRPETAH